MILESGEEILCGSSVSLGVYICFLYGEFITPLSGNEDYTIIHNLYNEDKHQFVSYKSV